MIRINNDYNDNLFSRIGKPERKNLLKLASTAASTSGSEPVLFEQARVHLPPKISSIKLMLQRNEMIILNWV